MLDWLLHKPHKDMDSTQESSGEMPVETRSAKRRRDDSGDEAEGEGVAQELLPVKEKKAYRVSELFRTTCGAMRIPNCWSFGW